MIKKGAAMIIDLKQLSLDDGKDVYDMLTKIPQNENGFVNGFYGRPYEEFSGWLEIQNDMAKGINLLDWMVPQTIYWLFIDGVPVGMGKLRHYLSDALLEKGGHCGYTICKEYRNKGYGTILLRLLMGKARDMDINRILVTIDNSNVTSIKVALANNGKIEKITDERHYIWIDCKN